LSVSTYEICGLTELTEGGRIVKVVGETAVGVFKTNGNLYAYENKCPHQGGPVCQGRIVPKTVENLTEEKESRGRLFDTNEMHVACPWHGAEFVISTGKHAALQDFHLRSLKVYSKDEKIFVEV
jgi:nitrite reductase/ring-hydroxylating ferredoxin subunit